VFRGLLFCELCTRRMQGQWVRDRPYYRCRFPFEYAQANTLTHPRNVYVCEDELVAPLDAWLLDCLAPHRVTEAVELMYASQPDQLPPLPDRAQQIIEECDRKIANYRALLDAGRCAPRRWLDRRGERQASRRAGITAPGTTEARG
jgi:hypothetical protein